MRLGVGVGYNVKLIITCRPDLKGIETNWAKIQLVRGLLITCRPDLKGIETHRVPSCSAGATLLHVDPI